MSTSITADSPLSVVMVTKVTIICVTHACLGGFFVVRTVFFSVCLLSVLIKTSFPLSIAVMLRGKPMDGRGCGSPTGC